MFKAVELWHCSIVWTDEGCETVFLDGARIGAFPHPQIPHYHVIAHRCGYGDDLRAYCREHEFCHSFMAEKLYGNPSAVLWDLAHGKEPAPGPAVAEEMAAQTFQRWLRANERPIIGGCDWDGLKAEALRLLA